MQSVVEYGGVQITFYRVIQHLSTLVGLACIYFYVRARPRVATALPALPGSEQILFWLMVTGPAAITAFLVRGNLFMRITPTLAVALLSFAVVTLLVHARIKLGERSLERAR
jgi:hypothetical protein